jgi:hypothetical protein
MQHGNQVKASNSGSGTTPPDWHRLDFQDLKATWPFRRAFVRSHRTCTQSSGHRAATQHHRGGNTGYNCTNQLGGQTLKLTEQLGQQQQDSGNTTFLHQNTEKLSILSNGTTACCAKPTQPSTGSRGTPRGERLVAPTTHFPATFWSNNHSDQQRTSRGRGERDEGWLQDGRRTTVICFSPGSTAAATN